MPRGRTTNLNLICDQIVGQDGQICGMPLCKNGFTINVANAEKEDRNNEGNKELLTRLYKHGLDPEYSEKWPGHYDVRVSLIKPEQKAILNVHKKPVQIHYEKCHPGIDPPPAFIRKRAPKHQDLGGARTQVHSEGGGDVASGTGSEGDDVSSCTSSLPSTPEAAPSQEPRKRRRQAGNQDGATTLSITARQYLGGPRLSTDLRPIFTSTALGASYELLQQLQLVEQAEAGDPDESPIQAWAAIELDGQLDRAARLVEFTPLRKATRGTHMMKGVPKIGVRLRDLRHSLRLERWWPSPDAASTSAAVAPPPLLVFKATSGHQLAPQPPQQQQQPRRRHMQQTQQELQQPADRPGRMHKRARVEPVRGAPSAGLTPAGGRACVGGGPASAAGGTSNTGATVNTGHRPDRDDEDVAIDEVPPAAVTQQAPPPPAAQGPQPEQPQAEVAAQPQPPAAAGQPLSVEATAREQLSQDLDVLMDMLLSSNLGAVSLKAVLAVRDGLKLHGTPSALALADELLEKIDLSGTISGDVRLALATRFVKWRTTLSSPT